MTYIIKYPLPVHCIWFQLSPKNEASYSWMNQPESQGGRGLSGVYMPFQIPRVHLESVRETAGKMEGGICCITANSEAT